MVYYVCSLSLLIKAGLYGFAIGVVFTFAGLYFAVWMENRRRAKDVRKSGRLGK